jgi:hypothetical protein
MLTILPEKNDPYGLFIKADRHKPPAIFKGVRV